MTPNTPAPRGMKWLGRAPGMIVAYLLTAASLALSIYVFGLYQHLADCTAAQQAEDQRRTAVLAPFTDAERAADRALLVGPTPGGPDVKTLRDLDLSARAETDRARAANPAPEVSTCS
jgi:hypothetical protein